MKIGFWSKQHTLHASEAIFLHVCFDKLRYFILQLCVIFSIRETFSSWIGKQGKFEFEQQIAGLPFSLYILAVIVLYP